MNGTFFPNSDIYLLRSEMGRLLDDFIGSRRYQRVGSRTAYPALNVWETAGDYLVEAELPGLKMEELELFIRGNELSIRGTRSKEKKTSATAVALHRQERATGDFHRVIELPTEVNGNAIEASLKNGVLTVKVPKAESAKPRKIAVHS